MSLLCLFGCSRSTPAPLVQTIPAAGTVRYHGRPVAFVGLVFHSQNPTESGFAMTNSQGEFRCMTNESSNGLPVGDYVVTIAGGKGIPTRYVDAESSPISVTVEDEGKNFFAIELTD
jgi:hypothetical protein